MESPRASGVLHDSPRTLTLNIESAKRHTDITQLISIISPNSARSNTDLDLHLCHNNDQDDMVSACPGTVIAEIPKFTVMSKPKHLLLYNNRHHNHVQEQHLCGLASLLHSLHCGNTPARDPIDNLVQNWTNPRRDGNCGTSTVFCTVSI